MREFIQALDAFFTLLMSPVYYMYYPLVLISLIYVGRMNLKKECAPKFALQFLSAAIISYSVVYCALTALLLYQRAGYALLGSVYLGPAFLLGLLDIYLIHRNKNLVQARPNDTAATSE